MFLIRRIHDDVVQVNEAAIRQVQDILRSRFDAIAPGEVEALPEKLRNPFKQRFRTILLVAETARHRVLGFAILLHEPVIGFSYLDFIATRKESPGRGIGGALYERVRQEARSLGSRGLFFECLPDDPEHCSDGKLLAENRARLRFYEEYGARPIAGTDYQRKIKPDDDCMPVLVFDGLGLEVPLARDFARRVVRAVLERKYQHLCTPEYVRAVIGSFRDDPVKLREPRYSKRRAPRVAPVSERPSERIALVVNDRHHIHHIRERGYVEAPVRISSILKELEASGLFHQIEPRSHPARHIKAVHTPALYAYLKRACAAVPEGKSVYPYVFPIRNAARPPVEISVRAGYYCIDTFTPVNRNSFPAARRAVDCAMTAADEILRGRRMAYALVRPPGHHAESHVFGGFCYFNNCAIAAHQLSSLGKVAILDVDYHHGNGQQEIFYGRSDVLTVSIHGHPRFAYPYFSGFDDEVGEGEGTGYNLNLPLPEKQDGAQYRRALGKALAAISAFRPDFLVVALGLDPAKGDPTGTWSLVARDFAANGEMIAELGLATLFVQEGGYRTRSLGANARAFFEGFAARAART